MTKGNSLHTKQLQNPIKGKPRNSETQSRQIIKRRNYTAQEASSHRMGYGFKFNKKSRIENEKKVVSQDPKPHFMKKVVTRKGMIHQKFSPVFYLKQGVLVPLQIRNSVPVFDLNPKERLQTEKEASMRTRAPNFDLNQISVTHCKPYSFSEWKYCLKCIHLMLVLQNKCSLTVLDNKRVNNILEID